jgi:hypothetical protein
VAPFLSGLSIDIFAAVFVRKGEFVMELVELEFAFACAVDEDTVMCGMRQISEKWRLWM